MDTKKNRMMIFGVLLILVIATFVAVKSFEKPRSTTEYPIEIHVAEGPNEVGFDSCVADRITFGYVSAGYSPFRFLNLTNVGPRAEVKISTSGSFADWVSVSDNNFVLETGESKEISVKVTVPTNAEPGTYDGILRVEFYNL